MTEKLTFTRERMEARRFLAGQMFRQAKGVREVARLLEVAPSSVSRWKAAFDRGGFEALKAKKHPGPKPRLDPRQRKRLVKVLLRGPLKAGYPNDLWTCPRVAQVIERTFGVRYHPDYVWHLLRQLGWTCQLPEQQAREGDDEQMRRWRREEWPRIKRGHAAS
jgi:transposase